VLSKNDFVTYFSQIKNTQRKVLEEIEGVLVMVKEDAIAAPLKEIKKDTERHLRALEDAEKLVKKTGTDAE
jgi:bacterioferritin (cytochrome b1)